VVDNRGVSNETVGRLPEPAFPTAGFGREGYRMTEVDEYVGQLRRALASDPPAMAPYEVADQRFAVTRWRKGYALRAVDDYLNQAKELLRTRHGDDPVASLEGRVEDRRHFPTGWIYLAAVVLAVLIVGVAITLL